MGSLDSYIGLVLKENIRRLVLEGFSNSVIIYHRVDWDGYTSGAIALMAYPGSDLIGWNYNDPLPDVSKYDKVILLDLTIGVNGDYSWMYENADKLIWIDHHSHAIGSIQCEGIEGVRAEGIGACVLAWEYFFGGAIPLHVKLCGTYDVFRKDGKYSDWEDAWAYQLALSEMGISRDGDTAVYAAIDFIKEMPQKTLSRIDSGYALESIRAQREVELFKQAEFVDRGDVRICKLIRGVGTPAHNIKTNSDNHTADIFFLRSVQPLEDGIHYKVEIRVPERSNIDASAIARQYGGNGHIKASGCIMTLDEFNSI